MKTSYDDLKPLGGLLLHGSISCLLTYATAGTSPILAGTTGIVATVANSITGNLASNHTTVLGNRSYERLLKRLKKTDPNKLNQDLEELFHNAAVSSLEFIKTLFVAEIKESERIELLNKRKKKKFLQLLEEFFDNSIDDLKLITEDSVVLPSYADLKDPNAYLNNIVDQIFRLSFHEFDIDTTSHLKSFYAEKLPYCFELGFKEALKAKNEQGRRGFIAFQIWVLEDLKNSNSAILDYQKLIEKHIREIKEGRHLLSRSELENILSQHSERLIQALCVYFTNFDNKLDDILSGINYVKKGVDKILEKFSVDNSHSKSVELTNNDPLTIDKLSKTAKYVLKESIGEGYFRAKYLPGIYIDRHKPKNKLIKFLGQKDKRCFAITGKAGKGKTNLLCSISDEVSQKDLNIVVLLNSPELDFGDTLTENSNTSLSDYKKNNNSIEQCISMALFKNGDYDFENIKECLDTKKNAKLVVFIDAINELEGVNAFTNFNDYVSRFAKKYLEEDSNIFLVVSCRTDFWSLFQTKHWVTQNIFREQNNQFKEISSYDVENFDKVEYDKARDKYFEWYKLKGELSGKAAEICHDPIMLRYFCSAYSGRQNEYDPFEDFSEKNFGIESNLRKKEVFDKFVKNAVKKLDKKSNSDFQYVNDTETYLLTTQYLLHLANTMYENKRTYILPQEVCGVAKYLNHPDKKWDPSKIFDKKNRSMAFAFKDGGIIIGKRIETEKGFSYDFVFESYFEYTLGRYIAMERWKSFQYTTPDNFTEKVIDDFKALVEEHTKLLYEKQDADGNKYKDAFTNLLNSLEYAVLVVEEDKYYHFVPDLFMDLVEVLLDSDDQRSKNMAFNIINGTKLLNTTYEGELPTYVKKRLNYLYDVLFKTTRDVDFVIMWALEGSMLKMADLSLEIAITQLKKWARDGVKIQPMYAIQVLTKIYTCKHSTAEKVLDVFRTLAHTNDYKTNFWLARPLILGAWQIAHKEQEEITVIDELFQIVKELYKDKETIKPIKGLALSVLPYLSYNSTVYLDQIKGFVKEENYEWAIWNLAYELRNWHSLEGADMNWLLDVIEILYDKHKDDSLNHINYALLVTLEQNMDISLKSNIEFDFEVAQTIINKLNSSKWTPENFDGNVALKNQSDDAVCLIYSPVFLEPSLNNHVECRERLQAILERLKKFNSDKYCWVTPRKEMFGAFANKLRRVHNEHTDKHFDGSKWPNYPQDVKDAYDERDKNRKDELIFETSSNDFRFESYKVALISASAAITAVDQLLNNNNCRVAWSLGRPPGHLANNKICIFNNIALAVNHAIQEADLERVLIIDCDAHHGKHTADVFIEDDKVVYCSIHIDGPYTKVDGNVKRIGSGAGEGYNINLVYPDNTGDDGYIYMVKNFIKPMINDYDPQMIFISAGFDGHFEDYLTPTCTLSEHSFNALAEVIKEAMDINPELKVCGVLEGGYGLDSWSNCFIQMLNTLGGLGFEFDKEEDFIKGYDDIEKSVSIPTIKASLNTLFEKLSEVKEKKGDNYKLLKKPDLWLQG